MCIASRRLVGYCCLVSFWSTDDNTVLTRFPEMYLSLALCNVPSPLEYVGVVQLNDNISGLLKLQVSSSVFSYR
jgi:hypothetical protein